MIQHSIYAAIFDTSFQSFSLNESTSRHTRDWNVEEMPPFFSSDFINCTYLYSPGPLWIPASLMG